MCELWVTVTSHSQVIVTLVWVNNHTLSGFLTQNMAFICFNRLNSRSIGSCMVMTTLHTCSIPPQGLHMLSFARKDWYPSLLLLLSLTFAFIPIPAILFLPFPSCYWAQNFKQPSNYPRASVLGCQALAHHDHTKPYSNCISWDHSAIKVVYLCAILMNMSISFAPYSHLFMKLLIRLHIQSFPHLQRMKSSTIECALVLDLVP